MSNTKSVIGLTIGPIYKTLAGARKTIELWAASYTFSYLMKRIVGAILDAKASGGLQVEFLQPYADAKVGDNTSAGLFPDRLMLESSSHGDFNEIKRIVQEEKNRLSLSIAKCFLKEKNSVEDITKLLSQYFQTYLIQVPHPGEQPLDAVNNYLETAELQQVFKPEDLESEDYLFQFFRKLRRTRTIINEVFEDVTIPKIRSLEEVALQELKLNYKREWAEIERRADVSDNYMDAAKEVFAEKYAAELAQYKRLPKPDPAKKPQKVMKKRHNYIAIVHADGDNVGKTVASLASPEEYQRYCGQLTQFQLEAVEAIKKYGGLPIYAGGDDLLFFAPVSIGGEQHVFKLAEELNKIFLGKLKDLVEEKNATREAGKPEIPPPTLSFGISISYYKYPLYEALEVSRSLLFGNAKHKEGKNAIAVRVLLHSGNYFGGTYSMRREADGSCADDTYAKLLTMLEVANTDANLRLNSITYALERNSALLYAMNGDELQMKEFFDNSFNEDVHQSEALQPFWRSARSLVATSYQTKSYREARGRADAATLPRKKDELQRKANGKALDNAYSVLRIIHFLNQADED